MNNAKTIRLSPLLLAVLFSASLLLMVAVVARNASAASLTQTFVRFDRMKLSTQTTGTICVKPATVLVEATTLVTFPTGYTLGTAANFTVSTTNLAWPAGATAWPGVATASNVTAQAVTFASTDLTVGVLYCFNWTNAAAVQVKSSATSSNSGTVTTRDSGVATIDTANFSTASISDDQIVVSATVPQSFSFALSGNTDVLGTLSTGSVTSSPTPRTATVNTNAKNGWYVWARDSNTGLTSASASATIASTTPGTISTLSAGSEGYNTGVTSSQTSGSGSISVAAPFAGAASTGNGLNTSLQSLATSNGTANNAVLTLTNNVSISPTSAAASDYGDTITVVGAGLF
jgi:hypothetical protein